MSRHDDVAACTGFGDCGCDVCCPEPGSGRGVGHAGAPLGRSGDTEPRPGEFAAQPRLPSDERIAEWVDGARKVLADELPAGHSLWKSWAFDLADQVLALARLLETK